MKKLLTSISIIALTANLSLTGQTDRSKQQNAAEQVEIAPTDAKSRFINNQDYLSTSSLKDFQSYYGDSLDGFNETAIKAELLNRGVYGSEYANYIPLVKRNFINQKYQIGAYSLGNNIPPVNTSPAPLNPTPGGSKNIGGGNSINIAPCVNEDFEATTPGAYTGATNSLAITGWTIQSGMNGSSVYSPNTTYGSACNAQPIPIANWNGGSPECWIVQTPLLGVPSIGTIPNSPLGGTRIIKMNDVNPTGLMTRISSKFPVTVANTLFQFAYAGSWDGVHECCGQPSFRIDMYQGPCTTPSSTLMACSNVSLTPSGANCSSGVPGYTMTGSVSWTNWVVRYIDLTPYIGSCVTIVITNSDCSYTGHHASAYFDARCGGQLIGQGLGGIGGNIPGPVSFCAGSNQAVIAAPLGYATYTWVAPSLYPPIPAAQATLSTLTVTNPIPGTTFTVLLTGSSGCQFMATNAIVFSTVNIAGIGSTSTCIGGASGSATVQGNGSGTGYNYTWINAGNSATVGTTAVVNGLAPGIYSVVLTGLGASGCGSAVATTTVNAEPSTIIDLLKPYCSGEAYLGMSGGSSFQWYNGLSPITASLGGTAPGYTVTSPFNMAVYWLSYMSQYGCRDSVKFTLVASPPGLLTVPYVSWICPGGNNGTAHINMVPAGGAPPGINSFSVYSTGTTPPYTSSVYPTASNGYTVSGLSAGTYSVRAFDGSCRYGIPFNVIPFVYNFSLSPNPSTLCPGNCIAAAVSFTSPPSQSQYSYSWTPNIHLAGGANTYSSTIICPNIPVGTQTTIIYNVIVTPSTVNCPITKTISITAVNPPIPTFSPIPNMCNTSAPYQIIANPTGGTYVTGITGTANPIGSSSGIISPNVSGINFGVNTFTYSIAINTCVATQTATYEVSQFQTAALTSSVPPLCVTNSPFNLMTIVQSSVNGTWTGTGTQFGTLFNPVVFNSGSYPLTGNYQINYNTTSSPNPTVCPATSPLFVAVTKTMTPFISQVPEFCTNGAQMNMTVSPAGGGWLATNPAVSNGGVITPTFAAVPSSIATYTLQMGPCLNSNTTQLNASRFYPAGFSGTMPAMCEKGSPFNLMSIVQSTVNGSWSGPLGSVNSNSFAPTGLATGNYTLNYTTASAPNPNLCPDGRSIAVSVLNPAMPNIVNVGPYCNNGTAMQLTVSPATGYWVTTPYLSSTGVFLPSLASVGNNAVQYVIGTNTCNSQQTKFVSIEAFVPAKISSALPDQCNTGSPVNLSPFTMTGFGTWSGVGIAGNTFNPGLAGSGTFVLKHKTASSPSGLCPDEDVMAVNVYSLASPVVTKVNPLCNSSLPFQLQVSPVGGLFGGSNFGVVSLEGQFNPAAASIGANVINYSITSGPCVAYAQTTVSVERFISADFAKEVTPFCLVVGKVHPVNMESYVQNPGGTWSSVTSPKSLIASMFDPFSANLGKNNVIIYRTHSMPTASLCPDTSAVRIEVREVPKVEAYSKASSACAPVEVVFNTPSVNYGEGTWNFDDGSEPQKGFVVSHIYTTPGTYIATFSYKDDIGCEALPATVNPVVVNEIPKADFSFPEEIYISSPDVQLTNLTTILGDNTYIWKVSGTSSQFTQVHPVVPFSKIGRYQITLEATTPAGCKDEISKSLEVKNDFNIYIPTSFSPNFDGLNDIFIPVFSEYGLDMKSFEMEIFDRWGHSLFRSKDPTKGWDGSVQNKGEPLKEEVYIYRIKYKDLDGNSYNKMGHVSLLK